MLLYVQGVFMQVLEGTEAAVKDLFYEKIAQDERHEKVNVVLGGKLEKRNFKNWTMGFKVLDEKEYCKLSGYHSLNPDTFLNHEVTDKSHPALIFLRLFYEKNYVDF